MRASDEAQVSVNSPPEMGEPKTRGLFSFIGLVTDGTSTANSFKPTVISAATTVND